MRTVLALLLVAGLLAAPLALAASSSGDDARAKGRAHAEKADARHAETHEGRNATDADDAPRNASKAKSHGRASWSSWIALRNEWHASTQSVRDACHAQEPLAENATKEERKDRAHCIRDGYQAQFQILRDMIASLRAERRAEAAS